MKNYWFLVSALLCLPFTVLQCHGTNPCPPIEPLAPMDGPVDVGTFSLFRCCGFIAILGPKKYFLPTDLEGVCDVRTGTITADIENARNPRKIALSGHWVRPQLLTWTDNQGLFWYEKSEITTRLYALPAQSGLLRETKTFWTVPGKPPSWNYRPSIVVPD